MKEKDEEMRAWSFGFLCAAFLFGALPLFADEIVRIEFGKGGANSDLKSRVQQLERAVDQLQRKVFELELSKPASAASSSFTTCYIKTPFDGAFYATEPTETAARAIALEKCNAKTNSGIYCEERNLKCGK